MAGRRRREVFLLLLSVVLVLLAGEAIVRLFGLADPRPTGYKPVKTKRREMRPTNSRHYRDLERVQPKPAGVHRVLSLGDSFAWGASVEFEDAYPQRLERGLTRRRGETWEVVNLALPGMNTVEQAVQLAEVGFAYQPDLVLLGYVLNDSEDAAAAETRRAADWEEARDRGPQPSLLDRSALLRLVRGRIWATLENRRRISGYRSMYADDAGGWIAAREALKRMGALCRERGVPFVVAIFPLFGNPLDGGYPFVEIHEKVGREAVAAGAAVVDLLPAYRGLRWDLLVADGANDEHPNEIAHRIAAGTMLRALDDVLPPAAAPADDEPVQAGGSPSLPRPGPHRP